MTGFNLLMKITIFEIELKFEKKLYGKRKTTKHFVQFKTKTFKKEFYLN